MKRHILLIVAIFSLQLWTCSTPARNQTPSWTQWRGPNRDGSVSSLALPEILPENLTLAWRVPVGPGSSSPVVANEKVYLMTRKNDNEIITCLDLNDGKVLWQKKYASPFLGNVYARKHGAGPFSTPALFNGQVYTLGIDGILSSFDGAKGELNWRHHYYKQVVPDKAVYFCPPCGSECDKLEHDAPGKCATCKMTFMQKGLNTSTRNYYGAGMSPIIENGMLISFVGDANEGALIALDPEDGKEKWRWDEDAPAYTSPVMVDLHGKRQLITLSQNFCVGIDPDHGTLLWRYPFSDYVNIMTPAVYGNIIVFSGYRRPTVAIEVRKNKNIWTADKLWENTKVTMYMSSPVVDGSTLYGFSSTNKGQFFAMDIKTGDILWESEGREGENASVLDAGNVLLSLTTDADFIIFEKNPKEFKPVKKYAVAESATWAYPAILDKNILVKDNNDLMLWKME